MSNAAKNTAIVATTLICWATTFPVLAYDKQDLVNAIRQAAHAYWAQRVVIEHPNGTFYGYSGSQTVIDPSAPSDRYYSSDSGWLREPHIFHEHEDSTGHSGAAFGFLRAYQATGDKYLMRAAKSLGDTLLSAQQDNNTGGWWYDMGVIGYDRQEGSPTFKQTKDYKKWVNYFPWGGTSNVMDQFQNLGSFDGVSFLPGYYLLRLYQALPASDPDRTKYLEGAKRLADTIVGFKDVVDADGGFRPYSIGGVPQIFPYNTLKPRGGVDVSAGYPYAIPHNLMPTLNDNAMIDALFFLIAFWQEAQQNASLDEQIYLTALRLNADYLMDRFEQNANPNGRGAWSSQYWVNDGSARAGKPTWGRAMEPPGVGFFSERADEFLVKWHSLETDASRKARIEDILTRFLLYWKYDAPPVNSKPEWRSALSDCPYYNPSTMGNYDPNNMNTWWWWLWYNHDASVAPLNSFVSASSKVTTVNPTLYTVYYADDALVYNRYNVSGYPMIRNHIVPKIQLVLVDGDNPTVNLQARQLSYYFGLDTEVRFFGRWQASSGYVQKALTELDESTGFFLPVSQNVGGSTRAVIADSNFSTRMIFLAWGVENTSGTLVDSDGDGVTDDKEQEAGTDPMDSESYDGLRPAAPTALRLKDL